MYQMLLPKVTHSGVSVFMLSWTLDLSQCEDRLLGEWEGNLEHFGNVYL